MKTTTPGNFVTSENQVIQWPVIETTQALNDLPAVTARFYNPNGWSIVPTNSGGTWNVTTNIIDSYLLPGGQTTQIAFCWMPIGGASTSIAMQVYRQRKYISNIVDSWYYQPLYRGVANAGYLVTGYNVSMPIEGYTGTQGESIPTWQYVKNYVDSKLTR